jgi:imidazolonepropionase
LNSADLILVDYQLMTMTGGQVPCGLIRDGALVIREGAIVWMGRVAELAANPFRGPVVEGEGRFLSPGLIDCHTHLVWGGTRAGEWEQRLQGVSYEEIARRGGGILSTVAATRAESESALYASARSRIEFLMHQGVTTFEIKSGYGLDTESELKILRVATDLRDSMPIDVQRTFLGAHAVPPEYQGRADDYVDYVCREMLPATRGHCDAVDVFCEGIGFDVAQTRRVFEAARNCGVPIKVHAEQLSNTGGAQLAAEMGALSADHLEYVDETAVAAMARHGTVAVLLPGAFYFIHESQVPPLKLFRQYQVPIAIATDANPGSSPVASLLLILNMACTLFRLTPEEALAAVTRNAARALGWQERLGTLQVGKQADIVEWEIGSPAELAYGIGHNPCRTVYKRGEVIFQR